MNSSVHTPPLVKEQIRDPYLPKTTLDPYKAGQKKTKTVTREKAYIGLYKERRERGGRGIEVSLKSPKSQL